MFLESRTEAMISVSAEQVGKRFGQVTVLEAIDLRIEAGELFFLLGPSGCGKTTLLRCIAGFYVPDSGRILFGKDEVTRLEPHRRNTGMVFQSYALWPHMTVADNVAFGLRQRKTSRAEITSRVGDALSMVKMEAFASRRPNQLSGGQQQRVALARALVIRPRCLLLDEPLSNLDAKLRQEMRAEIRRICKESSLTTIYVTHDQKEALSVADRIALLRNGNIEQVGTPEEIYRRPTSKFVADFVGETNFIAGELIRAQGGMGLVKTDFGEWSGVLTENGRTLRDGSSVTISLRPEAIQLDALAAEENCISGVIGGATYYGELAQYQFECKGGNLKVFELNPRFARAPAGTTLNAWANPEDVVILPE